MGREQQRPKGQPQKPKGKRREFRRGKGDGALYQRPDGLWVAGISVGTRDDGRRDRRFAYGRTESEAKEGLRRLQRASEDGTLVRPSGLTVETWLARWLHENIEPHRKRATLRSYTGVVKNHLSGSRLAKLRIEKVRPADVNTFFAAMQNAGVGRRTCELCFAVLRAAFVSAIALELCARNPVTKVARPRVVRREMQVFNAEQVARFLETARREPLFPLYLTALATGARQGELFALQWAEVDLRAGTLTVSRTLDPRTLTREDVKTDRARRQVDLPATVIRELREHRQRMLAEGNAASPWVFCDQSGGPLRASNVTRRSWKPLLRAAGLPSIRFHDLRHTYATLALAAGVPLHVVSQSLGHSSTAFTAAIYAHVIPSMRADAANKMEQFLQR